MNNEPVREFKVEKFRENLRKLIDARGLMVKDVAIEIGMIPSSLSRYMTGTRVPELTYLIKLANFFDVSLEYLIGLSEDRTASRQLPPEVLEFYKLYALTDATDRTIINAILNKYK